MITGDNVTISNIKGSDYQFPRGTFRDFAHSSFGFLFTIVSKSTSRSEIQRPTFNYLGTQMSISRGTFKRSSQNFWISVYATLLSFPLYENQSNPHEIQNHTFESSWTCFVLGHLKLPSSDFHSLRYTYSECLPLSTMLEYLKKGFSSLVNYGFWIFIPTLDIQRGQSVVMTFHNFDPSIIQLHTGSRSPSNLTLEHFLWDKNVVHSWIWHSSPPIDNLKSL